MAVVDDTITIALLVSAAFFVALAFGLLVRYRQVSQRISASSDLGHDLWQALEQRMKKQDERILDMMGRLEVVQSRVMTAMAAQVPVAGSPASLPLAQSAPKVEASVHVMEPPPVVQHEESHPEPSISQPPLAELQLDETQLAAIGLLGQSPQNTRQLTDALGKSREHTARVMKELFEMGLVGRNDATKPFVYQLTDSGRKYLRPS